MERKENKYWEGGAEMGSGKEKSKEQKKLIYEKNMKRRAERRAKGLCPYCGKKVMPGHKVCEKHYKEVKRKIKNRFKNKTVKEIEEYKEKNHEWHRKLREKRKAQGLCTLCGSVKADDGYATCEKCRAKSATRDDGFFD